jgi:hypothetical protein
MVFGERLAGLVSRLRGRSPRAAPETRVKLEERLKELMQELGNAINESLSDSDRIAAAIGDIKRAGYDVFLVLEATIGFNKREEGQESDDSNETIEIEAAPEPSRRKNSKVIRLTSQDQKFLRALKISVDEENR